MDMTREHVIAWCEENRISFNASDKRLRAPDGWMFAYTGDTGDEVLLTAIFTNTDDADVTRRDVYP